MRSPRYQEGSESSLHVRISHQGRISHQMKELKTVRKRNGPHPTGHPQGGNKGMIGALTHVERRVASSHPTVPAARAASILVSKFERYWKHEQGELGVRRCEFELNSCVRSNNPGECMGLRVHRVNQPVLFYVHRRLHIVVARTGSVSVRASWVSRPSQ